MNEVDVTFPDKKSVFSNIQQFPFLFFRCPRLETPVDINEFASTTRPDVPGNICLRLETLGVGTLEINEYSSNPESTDGPRSNLLEEYPLGVVKRRFRFGNVSKI